MRIIRPAATTIIFLCTLETISGQSKPEQSAPAPVNPIQTEKAAIYITASTKKGMLIRDLKPEDITITEDKVPAKIGNVACGKPEPLLVGILVDVSGSRRSDSHLRSHYDELERFLDRLLSRDDGTYVVAFNDKIYKLSEVISDRAEISATFDKLRKHEPRASTALYDTITAAAEADFRGRAGRRILIVMGDWQDNSSHVRLEEAVKVAQRNSTTIFAIVDADDYEAGKKAHKRAINAATYVTEETGGLSYDVEEKNDFPKVLQAIGGAVVGSCRVEYTTSKNPDTKKGVPLHVTANSKDISILYPRVRFSLPH